MLHSSSSSSSSFCPVVLQLVEYCEGLAEKGEELFLSLWERHLVQTTTAAPSSSAEACLSCLILAGHLSPPVQQTEGLLRRIEGSGGSSGSQQGEGPTQKGGGELGERSATVSGGGGVSARGNAVFFELIEKLQEVLEILGTPFISYVEERLLILLAAGVASKLELAPKTWGVYKTGTSSEGKNQQTYSRGHSSLSKGDKAGSPCLCKDYQGAWEQQITSLPRINSGGPNNGLGKQLDEFVDKGTTRCEDGVLSLGLVGGSIFLTNGRRSRVTGLRGGQTLRFLATNTHANGSGRIDEEVDDKQNIESEELHAWVEGSIAPLLNFCRQDALRLRDSAETAVCLVNAYACAQEPLRRYKVCGSYVHLLSELVDQQITKLIEIEAEASMKSLGLSERLQVVREAVRRKSRTPRKEEGAEGWENGQDTKERKEDSVAKDGAVTSRAPLQVSDKDLPENEGGNLLSVGELRKFFRDFYMALYGANALHLGYVSRLMHRNLRSRAVAEVSKAVLQAYAEVYAHTVALGLATHTPEEIAVLIDV